MYRKTLPLADNDEEMLQALLPLIPGEAGVVAMAMALAGMFIGAVLWLTGARFSRSLVTLSAVSMGALIGMRLPEWMGWDVSGMGPAVGGAMLFGLSGFLLHRMWIGLALGTVLSMWALLILWAVAAQGQTWERPAVDESTTIATYAPELWEALPKDFTRLAGYVSAAAMITGLATTLLWPRVGTVVLFSGIGVSMLTIMGLVAMEMGRPQWLDHLPAEMASQIVTLVALVAFGAVVQWRTGPAKAAPPPKKD